MCRSPFGSQCTRLSFSTQIDFNYRFVPLGNSSFCPTIHTEIMRAVPRYVIRAQRIDTSDLSDGVFRKAIIAAGFGTLPTEYGGGLEYTEAAIMNADDCGIGGLGSLAREAFHANIISISSQSRRFGTEQESVVASHRRREPIILRRLESRIPHLQMTNTLGKWDKSWAIKNLQSLTPIAQL
jgi:hypothetical protein